MGRNNIAVVQNGNMSQIVIDKGEQNIGGGALGWWYRYFAPAEPPVDASFLQREKVRRGKTASVAVLILILFLFTMLPDDIASRDFAQIIAILVGVGVSFFALSLNRRGFVSLAGVLTLVLLFSGLGFTLFTLPSGLTVSSLTMLDFSVIPDILVLAFFSANSLFPIVCTNIIVTTIIVVYGPHDATITSLLHHRPQEIFVHVYVLQLFTAAALYMWARSCERALKRADRAEEIAVLEKHENERQQRQLEQRYKLDAGVQQILQTLVAAANGDLKARAPLSQDHVLWQISVALNNLIARLQSSTLVERGLQKQIADEGDRVTSQHIKAEPGKVARLEQGGAGERARKLLIGEENERVTSARTSVEEGKAARPEQDDIVERSPRQPVPVRRKWVVMDTVEGKVVHPSLPDSDKKIPF